MGERRSTSSVDGDASSDEQRLRWLLNVGAVAACVLWTGFALHTSSDHRFGAVVMIACGVVSLAAIATGRRFGTDAGGTHLVLSLLGGLGLVTALRGYVDPSVTQWYVVAPLAAVLGGRPRKALVWAGIALLSVIALSVAEHGGILGARLPSSRFGPALSTAVLVGTLAMIGGLFERHRAVIARREAELQRGLFEAQKLDSLGRLAGAIAHDFNNLLAVIATRSELATATSASEAERIEDLEAILAAARHGRQLTGDLLGFAASADASAESLAPGDVVHEVARLLRRVLPQNVELVVAVAEPLPAVMTSHRRLHQVLMNLCLNAKEAMPEGGVLELRLREHRGRPPVAGAADRRRHYAVITVKDDGVGMSERTRERILDPFFTTKPRGTGLGLATVQRIVADCGGVLDVESAAGVGSRFDVYLPALSEPEQAPALVDA